MTFLPAPRYVRRLAEALLLTSFLGVPFARAATEYALVESNAAEPRLDAALGIHAEFGRWNAPVRLVYDPDGAPEGFEDARRVLGLVKDAIAQWERVCGVRFEVLGSAGDAWDDWEFPLDRKDGLVRISWETLGSGVLGRAAPVHGYYDENLGYAPYFDGAIELNGARNAMSSDAQLVETLAHEIGHLLGLGHSGHPRSMLFADPYNGFLLPREDDIRAVQVLYGPPAQAVDPARPVPEWQYGAPPDVGPRKSRYLFTPKAAVKPFLAIGGEKTSSVGADTADTALIELDTGKIGHEDNPEAIAFDVEVMLVDPWGYAHGATRRAGTLSCAAHTVCDGPSFAIAPAGIVKLLPGTWRVYLLDAGGLGGERRTLLATSLTVAGLADDFNRAPEVSVRAEPGPIPGTVTFALAATDPEGELMAVIWHPPGPARDYDGDLVPDRAVIDIVGNGDLAVQTIGFGLNGEYAMFVELIDSDQLYAGEDGDEGGAGTGFQTIMKLTVKLPLTHAADAFLAIANSNDGVEFAPTVPASLELLAAIADRSSPVPAVPGTGSDAARFSVGATADDGETLRSSYAARERVVIGGAVTPEAMHVGQPGAIFVVLHSETELGSSWSYRDTDGSFRPWSLDLASLRPALESSNLATTEIFEVFGGHLPVGEHYIHVGYHGADGALHHAAPVRITVGR